MIAGGLRARVACVDTRILDAAFAGREFDASLLAACRPASTRVARTASSIPVSTTVRCSAALVPIETGEMVTREPFAWRDFVLAQRRHRGA